MNEIGSKQIIDWMSEKISDQITFSTVIWSGDPNQEKWVLAMSGNEYHLSHSEINGNYRDIRSYDFLTYKLQPILCQTTM